MKLLADESLDHGIVLALEKHGFSVYSISKDSAGISDDEVLQLAVTRNELLITEDKDFGELTIRFNKPNCGIVLLRANEKSVNERTEMLLGILNELGDRLQSSFVVVDTNGIRARKLK